MASNELDTRLAELGGVVVAPPMPERLRDIVAASEASVPRRPGRELARIAIAAVLAVAAGLLAVGIRRDLNALSALYRFLVAGIWLTALVAIATLALLPPRHASVIRWRWAGIAAAAGCVFFILLGFVWTESTALSVSYIPTIENVLAFAPACLAIGTATSIVPLVAAGLLLRRRVADGAHWIGAAVGAASGCTGGLVLHWHCPIAEATHFGLVHGGVVAISTVIGAATVGRLAR